MRKALVSGTFDPVTVGHLDIIERGSREYDSVTVCVFVNPEKTCLFDIEKRKELLRLATAHLDNVEVDSWEGYTCEYARAGGYTAILRGYRDEKDLAYEQEMADYNLTHGGVPTRLLPCNPAHVEVSSTLVREAVAEGNVSLLEGLVPTPCLGALKEFTKKA